MVAIVDYGVGNLFSLKSSLAAIGAQADVTADPAALRRADRIILPGVGAFGDAADKLRACGLARALVDEAGRGKPILGICLGMQLLLDKSFEYGEHRGLGLIPGEIRPISEVISPELKIPHIGWNSLQFSEDPGGLFRFISPGDFVYFVHSYHGVNCARSVIATTEYGGTLTAAVARGSVFGCQFHPEKSGEVGLRILRAFCQTKGGD